MRQPLQAAFSPDVSKAVSCALLPLLSQCPLHPMPVRDKERMEINRQPGKALSPGLASQDINVNAAESHKCHEFSCFSALWPFGTLQPYGLEGPRAKLVWIHGESGVFQGTGTLLGSRALMARPSASLVLTGSTARPDAAVFTDNCQAKLSCVKQG
ncbi:unconventional myosin-XV [Platysternon megacephalum]|uniref:Unconventional myosin-XV n=1 Tax=Platysternon megacephalum TaxID=55544 RepID=A0A4D9EI51_9SAUR|nr:unconventional myosin-XV [Platysternon megacephalum]